MTQPLALCLTPDARHFRQSLFTADSFTCHPDSGDVDVLLLCEPRDVAPGWDPHRWPHVQLILRDWSIALTHLTEHYYCKSDIPQEDGVPRHWWSPAGHRRKFLAQVLPAKYERFAWIDGDFYLARPGLGTYLRTVDLGGHPVGAMTDRYVPPEEPPRIGLPPGTPYVNGGLAIVDRHQWQQAQVTERMLEFMRDHEPQCVFAEQSPFNAALRGDVQLLDHRYNTHTSCQPPDEVTVGVHFAGPRKPWQYDLWHGHRAWSRLYRQWFARSPWPELRR